MNPRFFSAMSDAASITESLRRWRRTDDVERLRMRLQRALRTAEEIMYADDVDADTRLKAVRAVVSAAREARKAIETREIEERIERLEALYEATTTNGHAQPHE